MPRQTHISLSSLSLHLEKTVTLGEYFRLLFSSHTWVETQAAIDGII